MHGWFSKWIIIASFIQSAEVLFLWKSGTSSLCCIRLEDENIPRPGGSRYLDVILDRRLSFTLYFNHIVVKVNKAFYILYPILARGSSLDIRKSCTK